MQKKQKKLFIFFTTLVLFFTLSFNVFAELKDPTRPYGNIKFSGDDLSTTYNLNVEGIIIGNNKKVAIINGQRLSIGDKIMNIKVTDISADGVRLQDETGPFTISLVSASVKKPAKK